MNSNVPKTEWNAKTVRTWQLAILRFAATLDNADRLAVMAIASEIDRLGPRHNAKPDFSFFRRTSAELCAAILRPNELTSVVLRQYFSRSDGDRLKRVFAAAMEKAEEEADQPKSKPIKRGIGLWRGLSSRSDHLI